MRIIPFSEIDHAFDYFLKGYDISHDEAYRRFNEVSIAPPEDLPADPFSREYADRYMDVYKKVSGRDGYQIENERCDFDLDAKVLRPFPYYTKSTQLAAQHYSLVGQLLGMLDCPEGSDILEFGFGWGHTTLALAMLGHRVTAVDIEDNFCKLVERRAEMFKADVDIVNSDFMWVEKSDKKFDAVIFFECFHHCWEFERLLKSLHRVMKPGGKVYFGAEPINQYFSVPWGVRLDGQSVFVARRSGWMELGFHDKFFPKLLRRTGWRGECVAPHFWRASSLREPLAPVVIAGADERLKSTCGVRIDGALHIRNAGGGAAYGMFGPYIKLNEGEYEAVLTLAPGPGDLAGCHIDVVRDNGAVICARPVSSGESTVGGLKLSFSLDEAAPDIEVRLLVPPGFEGKIERLTISEKVA